MQNLATRNWAVRRTIADKESFYTSGHTVPILSYHQYDTTPDQHSSEGTEYIEEDFL
jgi:hypothetical protein